MSFALEYRKKMQAEAREAQAGKKKARKAKPARPPRAASKPRVKKSAPPAMAPAEFVVATAAKASDTPRNRLRVLGALSLAGLILSVFNSGALVQYAGGLGYNQAALRVMIASENWHALMQDSHMTSLAEGIREMVTSARQSEWQDLAFGLELKPNHPYLQGLQSPDTAVKDAGENLEQPAKAVPEAQPELPPHADPVMRADVGR